VSVTADVIPLGTRLRQRREELGLTQTQAARQLDVARTAYRLWEMEAARPAPDRWRGIASWLGISMTALLLAGEMLSQEEAAGADRAAFGAGLTTAAWDEQSGSSEGDFFTQERAMIADQARSGGISSDQATSLRYVLDRIQDAALLEPTSQWHPGRFRKRYPSTDLAPALSRAAFTATAVGIPGNAFHDALLLTSELVSNSVRHSGSDWVELGITVDGECLRVEVSDQSTETIRPRTPDIRGGWGLTLLGALATRWGVDRQSGGKTIWIEMGLTARGARSAWPDGIG
jgi:transcriptional regulator with XRE-family HTH domain/anti-sigma regulatory factor (Ser/Thr protein kinase)